MSVSFFNQYLTIQFFTVGLTSILIPLLNKSVILYSNNKHNTFLAVMLNLTNLTPFTTWLHYYNFFYQINYDFGVLYTYE